MVHALLSTQYSVVLNRHYCRHHQSSHITTLLVNIFAYNHRHRRLIKYIISASQLTQICRWDLWIPRRRSKDSKPFARFTKYIPDKLDKWLQIYDEKVRDFIKTRIMIHERMNIQTRQRIWQNYCWAQHSYNLILFNVYIGPKSDHCLPSSMMTNSPTPVAETWMVWLCLMMIITQSYLIFFLGHCSRFW